MQTNEKFGLPQARDPLLYISRSAPGLPAYRLGAGEVVGILSELDCIKGVLTAVYNDGDPEHSLVRDVMCTDIASCQPGDSIVEVAQSMLDSRQRRRPVVDKGKLVGQVSSSNVLWALMEHSRRKVFNRK